MIAIIALLGFMICVIQLLLWPILQDKNNEPEQLMPMAPLTSDIPAFMTQTSVTPTPKIKQISSQIIIPTSRPSKTPSYTITPVVSITATPSITPTPTITAAPTPTPTPTNEANPTKAPVHVKASATKTPIPIKAPPTKTPVPSPDEHQITPEEQMLSEDQSPSEDQSLLEDQSPSENQSPSEDDISSEESNPTSTEDNNEDNPKVSDPLPLVSLTSPSSLNLSP